MNTAVRFAVLGLIVERPAHPYELSIRFNERVGRAWRMHRAQIYQVVYKLEEQGLVERPTTNRTGMRTAGELFRATCMGEEAFDDWFRGGVKDAVEPRPARDVLFVKLAFSRPHDASHLLRLVTEREDAVLKCIMDCARQCADREAGELQGWQEAAFELIVDGSIAALRAELRWLHQVRTTIERYAAPTAEPEPRGREGPGGPDDSRMPAHARVAPPARRGHGAVR